MSVCYRMMNTSVPKNCPKLFFFKKNPVSHFWFLFCALIFLFFWENAKSLCVSFYWKGRSLLHASEEVYITVCYTPWFFCTPGSARVALMVVVELMKCHKPIFALYIYNLFEYLWNFFSMHFLLLESYFWLAWNPESGEGTGLLRLHSTYRHDLKIYSSDEGRVQVIPSTVLFNT
jgi:hypothetical protein